METTLIYPHQLFQDHPSLIKDRPVYLIEDPLFFGNDPHWPSAMHQQKLLLHRASMKAYAKKLESLNYKVHYIDCPNGSTTDSTQLLDSNIPPSVRSIHFAEPVDHILRKRIQRFADQRRINVHESSSPNFLSPPEFIHSQIGDKRRPFMATFYQAQRKRMQILLNNDGSPIGEKWSFDSENRSKIPKNYSPPAEPHARRHRFVIEASDYVSQRFPNHPGSIDSFRWPVDHEEATAWLDQFIDERLDDFGIYEDAISIQHSFLHHSAITPMLNIGLLDPHDVITRVLKKSSNTPLNSTEGFIRQVIGWREFVRGIYQHRGTSIRNGNFWQFTRRMPSAFYTATTGIPPVDRVIRQLLTDAYCHHIERLMVLGNFMLLCRIHPDDVYLWFMEMFADSYDWVMVPNVYGMSQFADGGSFTTKPYISGSNYILKMSDEPKGPWCQIWDALFWTFIADYQPFFLKNPRLSMMVRNWQKMSPESQNTHRSRADAFLSNI